VRAATRILQLNIGLYCNQVSWRAARPPPRARADHRPPARAAGRPSSPPRAPLQACTHCHVESSPKRSEAMSRQLLERCLQLLRDNPSVRTLDITGGAPEFHPEFRHEFPPTPTPTPQTRLRPAAAARAC
jgi:hypothetical protein